MKKELFGSVHGQNVYQYTLENKNMSVEIISYGARIKSAFIKKDNAVYDVVLGYNTIEEYATQNGHLGATVGRVANRIEGGRYTLNGKEYTLFKNNGENTLHGGKSGFSDKVWKEVEVDNQSITLGYFSPDGEEGFGGAVSVEVKFSLTDDNSLKIEYSAKSDSDTPLNLTNHAYFNLDGECGDSVFETQMQIFADKITAVRDDLIPNGEFMQVKGTIYDFTSPKMIGDYLNSDDEYLKKFGCFDANYVVNGTGYRKVAIAKSLKSGIEMETFSDMDGVQFYTETFLEGRKGKSGVYKKGAGFCLETQFFPNAVNCKSFPSCILKKGEKFSSTTEYKFKF